MRDKKLQAALARSTSASEKGKTPHVRSTFGSTFPSQNVPNTPGSDHFWKFYVKKVHALWREAHFEIKMHKPHQLRSTFGSWDVENVYAVVARSTFPSQNVKNTTCSDHSWRFRCDFAWQVQGILHLAKSELTANREGFVAFPKKMAGVGHLKKIWTDACRVASAVQKTCSSEMLGGQGTDFLRGVAFWSIRSSGLLRWFCVTGAALRMTWLHFFVAGAYFGQMEWKTHKTHWHEAVSSALNFLFLKEVSQSCCIFVDVVKFKNWGCLAE